MMMPPAALPTLYRFADLSLDPARRRVLRLGEPIELRALDFDLLHFFVESAPNVVNADVLAEKVWGRHFVSPENLAQRVMLLRQSLGEDASQPRYIETVRNKGYRLIPVVHTVALDESHVSSSKLRPPLAAAATMIVLAITGIAAYRLVGTPQQSPLPASVAVLPFENLSPDLEHAHFAVGIQDEIVSQLTNVVGLRVIPVRSDTGTEKLPAEAARDLDVGTVLSGSVRYAGGKVRVTPTLTDATTGEAVWSFSYERDLSNIFAIQEDVAINVAHALSVELTPAERERLASVPTGNMGAYDLYLSAVARNTRQTREEILLAIEEVERALVLDRNFVSAWVLASDLRTLAQVFDPGNAAEHRARGAAAAQRALNMDPESGSAHAALGFALLYMNDWVGAEASYRRARSLQLPLEDQPAAGLIQLAVGNFAYAREILASAREEVPLNPTALRFLIIAHAGLGEWATVDSLYESGRRLFVSWPQGHTEMMHLLVGRNELERARAVPISDDDELNRGMLARLHAPDDALAELRRIYAETGPGMARLRREIATWAAHFGDLAFAIEAMWAAIDEQGAQAAYLWLPQLARMRQLPQFHTLLGDAGIVAYWQEYGWQPICRPLDGDDFECD